MVKLIVMAAGMILLYVSHTEAGQTGDYFAVATGAVFISGSLTDRNGSAADINYDNGLALSAYLGRQLPSGLRFDEELVFKRVTMKGLQYSGLNTAVDSSVSCVAAMSNLYYDLYHEFADLPYSPYLGMGVGIANVQMSSGSDSRFTYWRSGNDTALAYQVIGGMTVPLRADITLDASYRYLGTSEIAIGQVKTNFNSHSALVGIRYYFK